MRKIIDIKLFKYLTAFYTVTVLIALSKKVYYKTEGLAYEDVSWYQLLTFNIFLDWVVVIIFMTGIAYLTKRMFEYWDWSDWKKIVGVHLFFSFFIGYFIFITVSIIGYLVGEMPMDIIQKTISFGHFMRVIELNFLVYFSMIGIIHVYYYVKQVKQMEQQKSKLESHLANSKLNALKAQLQPHFIFNTLNSISSLIEEDKERSQNLIADFGDLLRDILTKTDQHLIPLEQELTILDKFMAIMDIRFSDHLVFKKDVGPGLSQALVPHMFLQPLVENAVKHGYSMDHTTLLVELVIRKEEDRLRIHVLNNGKPLSGSLETELNRGTGLRNTRDRLETQFGADFKLDLRNQKDGAGVELEVVIPFLVNGTST